MPPCTRHSRSASEHLSLWFHWSCRVSALCRSFFSIHMGWDLYRCTSWGQWQPPAIGMSFSFPYGLPFVLTHLSLSLLLRERVVKIRVSALRVSVPVDLRLRSWPSTPSTHCMWNKSPRVIPQAQKKGPQPLNFHQPIPLYVKPSSRKGFCAVAWRGLLASLELDPQKTSSDRCRTLAFQTLMNNDFEACQRLFLSLGLNGSTKKLRSHFSVG